MLMAGLNLKGLVQPKRFYDSKKGGITLPSFLFHFCPVSGLIPLWLISFPCFSHISCEITTPSTTGASDRCSFSTGIYFHAEVLSELCHVAQTSLKLWSLTLRAGPAWASFFSGVSSMSFPAVQVGTQLLLLLALLPISCRESLLQERS